MNRGDPDRWLARRILCRDSRGSDGEPRGPADGLSVRPVRPVRPFAFPRYTVTLLQRYTVTAVPLRLAADITASPTGQRIPEGLWELPAGDHGRRSSRPRPPPMPLVRPRI